MDGVASGAGLAAWLGILTSISPCPLATNVAAVSFIGSDATPRRAALWGLAYTAGRAAAYAVLGVVLVAGILSATGVSQFLQRHMNRILGPLLILAGMVLLDLLSWKSSGAEPAEGLRRRAAKGGAAAACALGFVFALSFCPVSAALFFGGLVPLALKSGSPVAFSLLYGAGTGIPVLVFAGLIAFASQAVGPLFERLTRAERWGRRVTGVVFVAVGVYYVFLYIFEVG